jgi:hypothetical protein
MVRTRGRIPDETEVKRLFEEGLTYQAIVDTLREKYNEELTISAISQLRYRRGWERRINRDDKLIPWAVKKEHRWEYPVAMLRAEVRRRSGAELSQYDKDRLQSFLDMLTEGNLVVHYDPDTEEGFFLVPREEKDEDIVRMPTSGVSQRRARD